MKDNEKPGKFLNRGEVRLVRILPGPIERVWEFLTDPEKRARWFAGGPMEPRKGGKVILKFRHANLAPDETPPEEFKGHHDPGHDMIATVTRWDPPRVLGYTFGSDAESEVVFELTPQDKNVLLVLTHRATGGDLPYMHEFAAGWHAHLAQLVSQLEGTARPPFWPMHAQLRIDYTKAFAATK